MIRIIKKILLKLISLLDKFHQNKGGIAQETNETIQAARVAKWFEDKGDETLRLNYPLNEDSVVFDVGGYKGEFARDIFCKYNSTIFIFEPITQFYKEIIKRFINNPKINTFNFGLGNGNYMAQISIEDDSSSLFKTGSNSKEIEIRSFNDFIIEHNILNIALAKINIEGSEYDLLESMIEAGNITKIRNIQIQFHDFIIDNAFEKMRSIQKKLSETHQLTYQYEFVWENWRLKDEE
jgi:FkbM family methyltransferase